MRGRDVGRMKLRDTRKGLHGCVIPHHEVEHAGEKARVGGGMAQRLRTQPAFGQEQAQPLGVAGDEGKRLNRNDFSNFPGVSNRLLQERYLPFANLWSLFWEPSCPSLRNVFKQVETTSHKDGMRA